jgi:hypothetical protein
MDNNGWYRQSVIINAALTTVYDRPDPAMLVLIVDLRR